MADRRPALLEAVAKATRKWLAELPPDDPQQAFLTPFIDFVDERRFLADYSAPTLKAVQALMCINCREIHPDLERTCCEQSLEGCRLLETTGGACRGPNGAAASGMTPKS